MKNRNLFEPVVFDPKAYAREQRQADPEFRAAYDALEDEIKGREDLLMALRQAAQAQGNTG